MRVFITGASSGLGLALAHAYAERGAILGLVARRAVALEVAPPERLSAYAVDVRDTAAMQTAAADYTSRYGCPDLVIANAGISIGTTIERSADIDVLRETLETNVVGIANAFQPFVQAMRARRTGTLVGIASVAGYRGLPGSGAYCASKAAAVTWLESTRIELLGSGVRVVAVSPGYIATPMTARNPFRMPFILSAHDAAQRVVRVIDGGSSFAVIPWQMAIVARAMRVIPNALFDRLVSRSPRKPARG